MEKLLNELLKNAKKIKSVVPFERELHGNNETQYWKNQAHKMQTAVSDVNRLVLPLVREVWREYNQLEKEKTDLIQEIGSLRSNEVNYLTKCDQQQGYIERLEKEKAGLLKEHGSLKRQINDLQKLSQKPHLNRFSTDNQPKNRKPRKGTLTDKQVKTILRIATKRGKYKTMSLRKALEEIQIQSKTYYKVIRLDYRSESTIKRIKRISNELGIKLPILH